MMFWLPERTSTRTRSEPADPEIHVRIIHEAGNGCDSGAETAFRDQTVEIAVGSNKAFENGNMGVLTRRVAGYFAVSAVRPHRSTLKLPKEPKRPHVTELLRKAIEWQERLESGECTSQAEIAARQRLTRARVTQIMGMLNLALEIREKILSMPKAAGRSSVTERVLRPITALSDPSDQLKEFHKLLAHSASLKPRPTA